MNPALPSLLAAVLLPLTAPADDWPAWRGPRGDGTSRDSGFPVEWSANRNLAWHTPVPGQGHASPIVHGNRVFTVSALPDTEERVLLCYDAASGRRLWQSTVLTSPLERVHALNSHASSTPATDGGRVFTAFLDVREAVVSAHDLEGRQVWQVRVGPFSSMHGFCSSPVVFEDLVIVNCDHDGDGYIVAMNRLDGRERWRIRRPNNTRSYCVPTVFEAGGRKEMVLSGSMCVAAYDPRTGAQQWIVQGPTEQFVASLVYHQGAGLYFMTGGFPDHHLLAIRPGGTGDVTGTHIAWRHNRASYVSYVPSPIAAGDWFLLVSDTGQACCFEAATGRLVWQEKLGEHHASPVSAAGLVYFLSDDGVATVVRPGPVFDRVARNEIGERCFASPALSSGRIFIRGEQHLFCLAKAP